MRKLSKILITVLSLNLLIFGIVFAEKVKEEQDLRHQLIKIKCSSIKLQLNKVNTNDSLDRVNYGQTYESIIRDLFTPVNTRLIVNRYSDKTSELVKTSSDFEAKVKQFREKYKIYQQNIDLVGGLNCQNDVEKFNQTLYKVQFSRKELKQLVVDIEKKYLEYKKVLKGVLKNEEEK